MSSPKKDAKVKITQNNVENMSFSSEDYGSEEGNMEHFYTQIGKFKAVVIPQGEYLTLS